MIGEFIYAWLKQTAAVTALIGSGDNCRVYPNEAHQGVAMPYVVWQVFADARLHSQEPGPIGLAHPLVQIGCWSDSASAAEALALAIRGTDGSGLDGYRGTLADINVQGSHLIDQRWLYTPPSDASGRGTHGVQMDFEIWFEE